MCKTWGATGEMPSSYAPTRASSSSRKRIEGATARARWKAALRRASPSPTKELYTWAPFRECSLAPEAVAVALAKRVLQQPAVPHKVMAHFVSLYPCPAC